MTLGFWLSLGCALALIAAAFSFHLLAGTSGLDRPGAANSPRFQWLLTSDGQRRGFALCSDLKLDSPAWELWGKGSGQPALAPIADLCPSSLLHSPSLGLNGGFWNENLQPVGVCAGERGIHASLSHPNGLAIADERAWIGPMVAHVRLYPLVADRRSTITDELLINPHPLPRRNDCLIEPAAYPGLLRLEMPSRVTWLRCPSSAPLRFNTTGTLKVHQVRTLTSGASIDLPSAGTLLWIQPIHTIPASAPPIKVGDHYRLDIMLERVRGQVRLATCAGPRLLKDGKVINLAAQKPNSNGGNRWNRKERTWRTAAGCSADGRRLWLVLLARGKDGLPGVTLKDTARTLLELGASDALNLDGGISTSVWSRKMGSDMLALFPLQSPINHALFLRKDLVVTATQP